ncbi:SpoIIE family protein phosphatase [Magnetospirillum sulfuroxidans]|uniref:SpoIIE family protein phosphatase n=1 Tax=Magnetospirillum sulfuroxidans TaxID=611300 RepID=A0ABS5IA39_9PROT|nr:SpoIIE family protein phosphatase [Magnetospirillum sulfuroxidans]MBR9971290.1 SpoIIE family protein phosphatase [Magnetospirillum sulfuroxidans]
MRIEELPHALPTNLADDLDLIAEMTADFARSLDIEETLRIGITHITSRMDAEAASIFLMEPETGDLVCRACSGPTDVTGLRLVKGQGIVWRAVNRNATELVRDTGNDPDFAHQVDGKTGFITRSVLCAPMSVRDERLGAIELFNKIGGGSFDSADRRVLQALAASAALALINARQAAAMAEQQVMRRELALAADIQRAMLPPERPAEFPIHGINLAARGVSGDFFDVVELPGGKLAFAIADVSGKGMNAALLMAKTASLFRCLAKRLDGPAAVLSAIDAELAETSSAGMFVTMIAGILDPAAGTVVLANAGHEPPLLCCGARQERIDDGMPPLGIVPELFAQGCPESIIDLNGGTLYLFTDGLTEAGNSHGMLGADGVARRLMPHRVRPAPDRLRALVSQIVDDGMTLKDDLTMVVIEDARQTPALYRQFQARPASLAAIRAAVAQALEHLACPPAVIPDVVLAVDEACQNIIRHAYGGGEGDLIVQVRGDAACLDIQLIDFAAPVDPARVCPRDLDDIRPGGLGTHFMRMVMDDVEFLAPPPGAGNLLRMIKRMGGL